MNKERICLFDTTLRARPPAEAKRTRTDNRQHAVVPAKE